MEVPFSFRVDVDALPAGTRIPGGCLLARLLTLKSFGDNRKLLKYIGIDVEFKARLSKVRLHGDAEPRHS